MLLGCKTVCSLCDKYGTLFLSSIVTICPLCRLSAWIPLTVLHKRRLASPLRDTCIHSQKHTQHTVCTYKHKAFLVTLSLCSCPGCFYIASLQILFNLPVCGHNDWTGHAPTACSMDNLLKQTKIKILDIYFIIQISWCGVGWWKERDFY